MGKFHILMHIKETTCDWKVLRHAVTKHYLELAQLRVVCWCVTLVSRKIMFIGNFFICCSSDFTRELVWSFNQSWPDFYSYYKHLHPVHKDKMERKDFIPSMSYRQECRRGQGRVTAHPTKLAWQAYLTKSRNALS